jgi:DNA (cytosine-5)-methyltransferase 1
MLDVGLQLALEWHGLRTRVVGYCERESSATAILLARMEEESLEQAPVWAGNLEELPTAAFRSLVDGVVGGIPCQPFSSSGKQLGLDDPRWLWPKFWGFTRDVGARFIAIENVRGFDKKGLPAVIDDLTQAGWAAEWCHLRASEVGAAYRRERFFLMAHADGSGQQPYSARQKHAGGSKLGLPSEALGDADCKPWGTPRTNGVEAGTANPVDSTGQQ